MFRIVCSLVTDEELKEVLKQPVLVVLDEAYVEFALEPSRMQWVTEYENLIVLRTFSKRAGEYIYLLPQLVSMK
jgi:histidinol-phosphate aminotransferase